MSSARRSLLVSLAILLGFVVLISIFLDPRIYQGQTLLVGDSLYYMDPSFRAAAEGVFDTRPSNFAMDVDNDLHNYPFRHYARASFARGEIPWWNPYVAMGVPFVGLASGVFDPVVALAGWLLPADSFTNLIAVLGLWIAASGMYAFLGTLALSPPARVLGAIAFTFSGWTIAFLGRQNFMAEIWMPWLFWATARLFERRDLLHLGLVALITGLVCLTGHLQTAVHILMALAIYVMARLLGRTGVASGERFRVTAGLCLAVALGVGIALVQIVPLAGMLRQDEAHATGRNLFVEEGAGLASGAWGNREVMSAMTPTVATAVAPLLFGAPQHETYWYLPGFAHFSGATIYAGLLPLFFALYAFLRPGAPPGAWVWLVLAVGSLGVAHALPVFNLVNYLPVLDVIDNGRLRGVYRFAVSVAAGIGLERFVASSAGKGGGPRLLLAAAYAGVVLALPVIVLSLVPRTEFGTAAFAEYGADTLWEIAWSGEVIVWAVLAVAGVVLVAWRLGWIGRTVFSAAMIVIAFGDSYFTFHDFNPLVASKFVFPTTPAVEFLKRDPALFRVSSSMLGTAMVPNTKLPYGIFDVDIYSVLALQRYIALQSAISPAATDAYRNFQLENPAAHGGLLDLMNVKYVVFPAPLAAEDDPLRAVDSYRSVYDDDVLIYENVDVLPRAFLVGRSRVVRKPENVLATLLKPGFDPRGAILLEDPASPKLDGPAAVDGGAEVVSLEANRVVVHARTAKPAYLVLSDAYAAGWTATVDGVESPIYPAYYLFRAVYLEPGEHEVVFRFMPASYRAASLASLACLLVSLGLVVVGAIRSR